MSELEAEQEYHSLTLSPVTLLLLLIFTLLLSAELNNARLRLSTLEHTTGVVKEGSTLCLCLLVNCYGKFLFSILSNIQQVEHEKNLPNKNFQHHYQNPSKQAVDTCEACVKEETIIFFLCCFLRE